MKSNTIFMFSLSIYLFVYIQKNLNQHHMHRTEGSPHNETYGFMELVMFGLSNVSFKSILIFKAE